MAKELASLSLDVDRSEERRWLPPALGARHVLVPDGRPPIDDKPWVEVEAAADALRERVARTTTSYPV